MNIETVEMRRLAILLLDDPHGINRLAFEQLAATTGLAGFQDIYERVQRDKGRVFLPEDHGLRAETVPASAGTPPTTPRSTS